MWGEKLGKPTRRSANMTARIRGQPALHQQGANGATIGSSVDRVNIAQRAGIGGNNLPRQPGLAIT